ncbi:MAG TPA: alpha/beta fold hydrolase [Candidatus Saccharimonadales bacterium]|nr:alpha/beta fold hydrolase [Candidatus Saccharimonadales bacterium]
MPSHAQVELIRVDDPDAPEDQYLLAQGHMAERRLGSLALLYLHGWRRPSNDRAARRTAEVGWDSYVVNFRGHNGSDGDIRKVSRADALLDALSAYDYIEEQQPPGTRIGLVTHSFSAYIGILLTQHRDVACISMRAGANYADKGFDRPQYGKGHVDPAVMRFREQKLRWNENKALTAIHEYGGPIQIIESGQDTYVPHQTTQNYLDAASDPSKVEYHLKPEWEHLLVGNDRCLTEYEDILIGWLRNSVEPALRLQ